LRRLVILNPGELTRDPRARRAASTGSELGWTVIGLCTARPGETALPLPGVEVIRIGSDRVSGALRRTGLGGYGPSPPLVREARGLFRLARFARQTARLVREARRLQRFDIVHANENETLVAGWVLARRWRARLVYDAHEFYASSEPGYPRVYGWVMGALEGAIARRAAVVTTVSAPIGEELQRRFRLPRAPVVVLNAPQRTEVPDIAAGNGPVRVVYQGAMGASRPLADLLDALERAAEAQLTIRVAHADVDALRAEVARRGLAGRAEVVDPVPPTELVRALVGHDVGVVLNRPLTRNDELVFPNKLFEYMMAGLAVVAPRLPGITPFIEGEHVGLTFEPGRPDSLGDVLSSLAADRDRLLAFRRQARRLALERYNAEAQRDALVEAWTSPVPSSP
jgi:glycogen(starch) synthase